MTKYDILHTTYEIQHFSLTDTNYPLTLNDLSMVDVSITWLCIRYLVFFCEHGPEMCHNTVEAI